MENKAKESVKNFMEAFKNGDHKLMLENSQKTYRVANTFQKLKGLLPNPIKSFEIGDAKKESDVMYDVSVKVKVGNSDKQLTVRTVCEIEPWKPSTEGEFGVNPLSVLEGLNKK